MLSKSVQSVLRDALLEVQRRRHDLLTVEHLLYALSNSMKGRVILEGSGASVAVLREQLEGFFRAELEVVDQPGKYEVTQTDGVQRVLERALNHIRSAGRGRKLRALFSAQTGRGTTGRADVHLSWPG